MLVEYERRLLEAAVLAAIRGHAEERVFLGERDRAYENPDPEAREQAFATLHEGWFARLALDAPFRLALDERPEIRAGCGRCLVARAVAAAQEMADLRVASPGLPILLISVRVETISRPSQALDFLRRELLHVADMLDPDFGYEPTALDGDGTGPDRLRRERYRVLWDTWVDGRLVRQGRARGETREERLREFARAFPMRADAIEPAFERFFEASHCTHAELVAFATGAGAIGPRPCRLCRLPTFRFESGRLDPEALSAVRRDFPAWTAGDGICPRCAEVYASRAMAS